MWPGYEMKLNIKEDGIFLNLEPTHKVVRDETAFDII